jgi:predicted DNA-binding ribbon-helix-helix protein
MVRVTVDLDAETVFKLKRIAQSRNMSLYMLVKEALKELAQKATPPEHHAQYNIAPNAKPNTAKTRVYCKSKVEVRNIERHVKSLREKGVLVNWWEEEDRYCFEVKA